MDQLGNLIEANVASGGIDGSSTTLNLETGHGSRVLDPASGEYNLIIFNATDYGSPLQQHVAYLNGTETEDVEFFRVTGKSTDALTVTRAQENTSAVAHNKAGKQYKVLQVASKKLFDDLAAAEVELDYLHNLVSENALNILEIQAADTLEAGQAANMIRDIFTDADGFLNTVDTGNTTAIFDTDKYPNKVYQEGSDITEGHGITISSLFNTNNPMGMAITPNKDIILKSVTKVSSANPTRCRLFYSDGTSLGSLIATTTTLSGDVFTFSTGILLKSGVKYKIELDNNGSNYNAYNNNAVSTYPITETDFTWNAGSVEGSDNTSNAVNIVSITYSVLNLVTDDAIVQTSLQTLDSSPSNFQIYGWKKATTGTGSITADISFDNGSNWQTDIPLDTATAITNTGTQMILKINLNAGASEGTAELKGYGVMIW